MMCSFDDAIGEFNPRKAKIKILKDEENGVSIPRLDCVECCRLSRNNIPICVEVCRSGALVFAAPDEVTAMRKELVDKRAVQPIFKVIAPWKWPFPWRKWPFEEAKRTQ
jgi:Fe-S-cluster-containing dehydrogenase component